MFYPLIFQPIFKERIWGGRNLERLYQKPLPPNKAIGESWEICDRPSDVSQITNGRFAGRDLRWLMERHTDELLGSAQPHNDRFPLLVKILDAQDKLSLQVHPPATGAARLGGEPKTEMWYVTHAEPGAELFAGLKRGVAQSSFEQKIQNGTVAECFHRLPVRRGDVMFLPAGRVHAIGAGVVLFEIQQNSDTTYRVFDWNRPGLDGQPRQLHVAEALSSINFKDHEPALVEGALAHGPHYSTRALVNDASFKVNEVTLRSHDFMLPRMPKPQIIGLLEGQITVSGGETSVELRAGQFCLVPACLFTAKVSAAAPALFLMVDPV